MDKNHNMIDEDPALESQKLLELSKQYAEIVCGKTTILVVIIPYLQSKKISHEIMRTITQIDSNAVAGTAI